MAPATHMPTRGKCLKSGSMVLSCGWFCPQGAWGCDWRHMGFSQLEGGASCWLPLDRGQGCCSIPSYAGQPTTKNDAAVEKLSFRWSSSCFQVDPYFTWKTLNSIRIRSHTPQSHLVLKELRPQCLGEKVKSGPCGSPARTMERACIREFWALGQNPASLST